jgi:hypothetical protein
MFVVSGGKYTSISGRRFREESLILLKYKTKNDSITQMNLVNTLTSYYHFTQYQYVTPHSWTVERNLQAWGNISLGGY